MKYKDLFSPWCGHWDESPEKSKREKEREREENTTIRLLLFFFLEISHNAQRTLIIYLTSQEQQWTDGGKRDRVRIRPVVFTRNQFVLLRGNIGWGAVGVLLLETLAEYEKSGFKQAGNNTLVCEAIKNNYFHVRLIFTNGVIESTLSSPRFLGSN